MTKANVTLPNGAVVTIEGKPEEVAATLEFLGSGRPDVPAVGRAGARSSKGRKAAAPRTRKPGPTDHVRALAEAGFFAAKRGLGDVQAALEERALFYPATTLSPTLVRLVRARELRRIKEEGQWKYVNA
jgi:hypothetical protein